MHLNAVRPIIPLKHKLALFDYSQNKTLSHLQTDVLVQILVGAQTRL